MDHNLLENYYQSHYPVNLIYSWLCNGRNPRSKDPRLDNNSFERREFSFILKGDIYTRHRSFETSEELRKGLVTNQPEKIDIGAVWTIPPRTKGSISNTVKYEPVEKEFVIDIDMTDYDDVRTCCSGAVVCQKCWKFLVVACKSIDFALRESFGFELNLWVFSGRRGIHCWVSDPTAKRLNDFRRKSLIEFLNTGPKKHTPFMGIYKQILSRWFEEIIVEDQNLFASEKHVQTLVKLLGENITGELKNLSSKEVWRRFCDHVNGKADKEDVYMKVMFKFLYPRLDVNVSTAMNHLLKSPFSVHPQNGNVCIPIDPNKIELFDLRAVPTIQTVCGENDYEFTKAARLFIEHIKKVLKAYNIEKNIMDSMDIDDSLEF